MTICHNGVYIYNIIFVYQLTVSVEKRKKILFVRFDSLLSSATKSKAWEDVAREISGVGGGRTAPETKKKWCQVEFFINIFILIFHIGQVNSVSCS